MLESDPVGATWGPGVRRAPNTTNWGWSTEVVSKMRTPALLVAGIHDKQVNPNAVRDLYADMGSKERYSIDLGCSSHNAMWEKNHLILFKASLEWLVKGSDVGNKGRDTQARVLKRKKKKGNCEIGPEIPASQIRSSESQNGPQPAEFGKSI